jgi:hypothetical protein
MSGVWVRSANFQRRRSLTYWFSQLFRFRLNQSKANSPRAIGFDEHDSRALERLLDAEEGGDVAYAWAARFFDPLDSRNRDLSRARKVLLHPIQQCSSRPYLCCKIME